MAKGGAAMTRFEQPRSVAEAASLLAAGDWALLAGGTDLYPAHVGRPIARPLLDLSGVEGLPASAAPTRAGRSARRRPGAT